MSNKMSNKIIETLKKNIKELEEKIVNLNEIKEYITTNNFNNLNNTKKSFYDNNTIYYKNKNKDEYINSFDFTMLNNTKKSLYDDSIYYYKSFLEDIKDQKKIQQSKLNRIKSIQSGNIKRITENEFKNYVIESKNWILIQTRLNGLPGNVYENRYYKFKNNSNLLH